MYNTSYFFFFVSEWIYWSLLWSSTFILLIMIIIIATAKLLQSWPTLCDPIDGSPPGSPIPGILQARILEWVAIALSNGWKQKVKVKSLSRVRPSATPWTAALQAPPSMGFSRQEYWSGVPLPSPINCWLLTPNPRMKLNSTTLEFWMTWWLRRK